MRRTRFRFARLVDGPGGYRNRIEPLLLSERDDVLHGTGEITFIGTATVLVRLGAFTFLTDPNFLHAGERAYLGGGLWSKRRTDPAMPIRELPALDFVVLSHHHGDHFDRRAAAELDNHVPIFTEPGSVKKLHKQGFVRAVGLPKWESAEVRRGDHTLRITAMPGKHSPSLLSPVIPSVMGSLIEVPRSNGTPFRMYVTGDTLVHDELIAIPERYPGIDLCLIHLGGTRIAGVLLTMDADQGVKALQIVSPAAAMPIHYDDYGVFKSPLSDFRSAAAAALPDMPIHYVERGATHRFDL